MPRGFVARKSIVINAPPSRVWGALMDPELIEKYLFGTKVNSDWKEGSTITYEGSWQSKPYHDKGIIVKVDKERILESTYMSSISGLEDKPENYALVSYKLEPHNGGTLLTLTQDNNPDEVARDHSEKNWQVVLNTMKQLLEN